MCYQNTFRNHNNLNYDRIFHAKRQLSLILLNRTAALPAALSNLTRPIVATNCTCRLYLLHNANLGNSGGSRKKYLGGLAPHHLGGNNG